MNKQPSPIAPPFLVTKEYRRFAEFCDACRRYRYIGLCYGAPGVGKTLSARHYANWNVLEPLVSHQWTKHSRPKEIIGCQTVLYTSPVVNTPQVVGGGINALCSGLNYLLVDAMQVQDIDLETVPYEDLVASLIIVDEADRLKMSSLEHLRDMYDRRQVGLILIGIPGMEKRLARYPQFYSRVGFVHHFRPLSKDEMKFILEQKWEQLGIKLRPDDFTDAEALAAVIRITGGNFRLIQRLYTQIERILQLMNYT